MDADKRFANVTTAQASIAAGLDVNQPNSNGYPPIVVHGGIDRNLPVMRLLVQHGADIDAVGPKGMTTLMHLATHAHPRLDCIRFVLRHDADVQIKDHQGQRALDFNHAMMRSAFFEKSQNDGRWIERRLHDLDDQHGELSDAIIRGKRIRSVA
jgi:ankyrin repeat protein